jgi:lactoylglutathione lyase
MATITFDHIHLFSPDPEATAAYYERVFGAEVIRTMQQGKPRIDLKVGGANLFIMDVSENPKAEVLPQHPHIGVDHFGFTVTEIDKVYAELTAKGAEFEREPVTARPGTRIAFVKAIDGVRIEIMERSPKYT